MSICHDYCRCAAITVAVAATALKLETQAYRGLGRGGIAHRAFDGRGGTDPEGKDRGLQQMVLIGHSQGGLLMKMSVIDPGTRLWETMFRVSPEKLEVGEDLGEGLTRELERKGLLIFEPLPVCQAVIFVATRIAAVTGFWMFSVFGVVVRESPGQSGADERRARDLGSQRFATGTYTGIPTAITNMNPSNRFLQALESTRS